MEDFNRIYDNKIIKYTLNIPVETYARITRISRKNRISRSVWMRSVIDMALDRAGEQNTPLTINEIVRHEIARINRDRANSRYSGHQDPPRKFSGFHSLLGKNLRKLIWFKKKKNSAQMELWKDRFFY